ncbi:outer membrane protein assembly factor BamE [Peribacillus asahii]|uniref:Outer membrane protein assembly factor BamE n=1 Tax=Peribacillus asahii TaxID=228899 RepID=A0A398BE45_9BACI|nr:outer membrane protein assembly factor BamE [Peribacillus asahii]RID87088.1 outer membrane protein assembly factor BamE [Peribacillus asahii]
MWVFSVLFLLSGLITIVGLFLLIPKKTRTKGKQISIGFFLVCLVSYAIAPEKSYPNDEPGTITKAQYKQIKDGMTKDKIINILGEPHSKDDDINEWEYSGINGVEKKSYASFHFDPDDKLEFKLEGGLLSKIETTDASTNDVPANEDYTYDIEFAIEETIGENVNWDDESKDVVKKVEVNDNIGKNDGSKLILVHLNGPIALTGSGVRQKVNEQTLEIAKALTQDDSLDFEIDSITYWWYLPLTDSYGKTKEKTAYKISLERDTLENINYEDLAYVDLPTIANQYNVLFNDQE